MKWIPGIPRDVDTSRPRTYVTVDTIQYNGLYWKVDADDASVVYPVLSRGKDDAGNNLFTDDISYTDDELNTNIFIFG